MYMAGICSMTEENIAVYDYGNLHVYVYLGDICIYLGT
jgi:hypothetical protein